MTLKEIKHINQFEHMVMHFWGDGSCRIQFEVTILLSQFCRLCLVGRSRAPPLPPYDRVKLTDISIRLHQMN